MRTASLVVLLAAASLARADRLTLFAGGGEGNSNVPAVKARLHQPFGIDFDEHGNAYIVEIAGRLLKVDPAGTLTAIAGIVGKGDAGDGGPAAKAVFNGPHNLAIPAGGADVYIADTWNARIRKYDPKAGTVVGVAGSPVPPGKKPLYQYAGDGGPASEARFSGVFCVSFNPAGDKLYITDLENRRIRALDLKTGRVDLVAGNGQRGVPADGAVAREAPLVDPRACAVDVKGNVYILERSGHALRVVDPEGKIRTVAGTGKAGNSGDGGDARKATLNGPKHLAIDRSGNVIIADTANHVIRRYDPKTGIITRIAGTGAKGDSGSGGDPLAVPLHEPHGVTVRADGVLFIVDSYNHRVFRWEK